MDPASVLMDLRKGPDDRDPTNWSELSPVRQAFLLLNSPPDSEIMKGYLKQITEKAPGQRSAIEQMYLGMRVIGNTPRRTVRCEPRPPESPSYIPYLVVSVILAIVVLVLLVLLSRKNGWRVGAASAVQ